MAGIRNILICPLDWGLGHAARMIPLARELMEMNKLVYLAGSDQQISFFRSELPGASYIKFPGFRPRYSRYLPQYVPLLLTTPLLLFHIILEHFRLRKIIKQYDINIVISDNRFGLWNSGIKTVYVTHMPLIPFPKPFRSLEFIGIWLHRIIIKKYSFCYIPDLPGELNVSGRLSHGIRLPGNTRYIGILSRFRHHDRTENKAQGESPYFTVILSGPEPQKGILKAKLLDILREKDSATVIFEGNPAEGSTIERSDKFTLYKHLGAQEMQNIIKCSKYTLSRSGYSTIMDLLSLGCRALLIPTPGQTEQEYLAEYLSGKGWFSYVSQKKLEADFNYPSLKCDDSNTLVEQSRILLQTALKELLEEPEE